MSKQDILEMQDYVAEAYSFLFDCDLLESKKIVKESSFAKTLHEDPTYVMHYDDEHWARKIQKEVSMYLN